MNNETSRFATIARSCLLVLLALATLVPLALLIIRSAGGEWFFPAIVPQSWSSNAWSWMFGGNAGLATALRTSLVLAVATGAIATAISLPIGRAIARLPDWRRYAAAAAVFAPIAAPPIALGIGIQYYLFSIGLGGTPLGVLLAHLVPATGYLSLYFLAIFTLFDTRLEDEARTLGATQWQVLRHIVIPMVRRQIVEAAAIGFLISWAQYALTLTVGGGAVKTLPLEVFAYMSSGADSFAASAALVMIVPPLIALAAARYAAGQTSVAPV